MKRRSTIALTLTLACGLAMPAAHAIKNDQPGTVKSKMDGSKYVHYIADKDGIAEFWLYNRRSPATGKPALLKHKKFNCDSIKTWKVTFGPTNLSNVGRDYQVQFTDCTTNKTQYAWITTPKTSLDPATKPGTWMTPDPKENPEFDNTGDSTGDGWLDWLGLFTIDTNTDLIGDLVLVANGNEGATVTVMTGFGDGTFSQPSVKDGSILHLPFNVLLPAQADGTRMTPAVDSTSAVLLRSAERVSPLKTEPSDALVPKRIDEILHLFE